MGAWGEGMQANDTAMDYIAEFDDPKRIKNLIKGGKKAVAAHLKAIEKHSQSDSWAVLGVADYLIDRGFDISSSMRLLKKHLRRQRSERMLGCWTNPAARKGALDRFEARANGKEVDETDVEIDNMGLFARIGLKLDGKTTEDLRNEIKKEKK